MPGRCFSTKRSEGQKNLYHYGQRFYSPGMGRWLSRDPIGEKGGENCYQFAGNDSVNNVDILGYWSEKLRQCVHASKFTINIRDGTTQSADYKSIIITVIKADLNPEKCDCVCEFPQFIQEAREYQFRDDGRPPTPGKWLTDQTGRGDYYDNSPEDKPSRFFHMMIDMPGIYRLIPIPDVLIPVLDPPVKHFKADMFTKIVCTGGSDRGAVIRMIKWGVEVTYVRDARESRKWSKAWWPITMGDRTF